jgi:hypothetical protein
VTLLHENAVTSCIALTVEMEEAAWRQLTELTEVLISRLIGKNFVGFFHEVILRATLVKFRGPRTEGYMSLILLFLLRKLV